MLAFFDDIITIFIGKANFPNAKGLLATLVNEQADYAATLSLSKDVIVSYGANSGEMYEAVKGNKGLVFAYSVSTANNGLTEDATCISLPCSTTQCTQEPFCAIKFPRAPANSMQRLAVPIKFCKCIFGIAIIHFYSSNC